ncbi:hypothetical protein KHP62_08440 [Rhodobacteraceae bacterium NNCM2]|nr:hypothetical protein [Coraliihabitans acroporae]
MDDVMASIRRIIRSEKTSDSDTSRTASASDAEIVEDDPAAEAQEPFSLTPDMRVDQSGDAVKSADEAVREFPQAAEAQAAAEAAQEAEEEQADAPDATQEAEVTPPPAPVSMVTDDEPKEEPAEQSVMLDEAAIESMIRRVLREELMGEIGQNISANVTRMIETEVTRRLTGPK